MGAKEAASSSNKSIGSIATKAREKIQTSARELIRNLEDVVTASSSASTSPTRSSEESSARASIEQAFRIMFGSCTNAAADQALTPTHSRDLSRKSQPSSPSSSSSSSKSSPVPQPPVSRQRSKPRSRSDFGEHIYAQLFHDDDENNNNKALRPFPVSSPPPPPAKTLEHLTVVPDNDADDTISAISAHTLEAMVRNTTSSTMGQQHEEWKRAEQAYWDELVAREDKTKQTQKRQQVDPDRLMDVLVMDYNTEMAEI